MATAKIIGKPVIYEDFSTTLTSSSGRVVALNTAKTGYSAFGANFVYNNDFYYLIATDGVYPTVVFNSSGNAQIVGLNKELKASNRTITVRVSYIKN